MSYALSVLDKSPIVRGEAANAALQRTVALAQRAEALGFHRFWVAEHHNTPDLASSSPEVLIAYLTAHTKHIRIGSGGVMLQHYSPYKVAENFNLLASLAPGRIDIGVGKAPGGGLPLSTRALQGAQDPTKKPAFAQQLGELDAYLATDAAGRTEGLDATPRPATGAERHLLGASVERAKLAAELGWNFVFARHLNGDDETLAAAVDAFRSAAGRAPIVAVAAIIAESGDDARSQAEVFTPFKVHIPGAQSVTVGSEAQAAEYARQAGVTEYTVERKPSSVLAGSAHDVLDALDDLADRHAIGEFIIDFANAGATRLSALDLLAEARKRDLRLVVSA